jgi:hypothetical protein
MDIMISCMEAVVKNWDGFELVNLYTVYKLKHLKFLRCLLMWLDLVGSVMFGFKFDLGTFPRIIKQLWVPYVG